MKLLIIDSDEYYHHQFKEKLPAEFELFFAKSLEQGRNLISHTQPDLVVSELLLEDGPSFGLLAEMSVTMPVVVFSKVDHVEDIQESLSLGVSGYFIKGRDSISDLCKQLLTIK